MVLLRNCLGVNMEKLMFDIQRMLGLDPNTPDEECVRYLIDAYYDLHNDHAKLLEKLPR
jgi:hypothetical protein